MGNKVNLSKSRDDVFFFFFFVGVNSVTIDVPKDLVTLKGTMEVNGLGPYLQEKLKRSVEVIPPKKEEAAADKKEDKPAAGGGGGEKDSGDGGKKKEEGNVVNVDVKKMEYGGYPAPPMMSYPPNWNYAPTYGAGPPGYGAGPSYAVQPYQNHHMEPYHPEGGYSGQAYATPYPNDGYAVDHRAFSDENPNACSVM